ncbi:MAG: transcription termination factor Rho [Chlamydiia bacterium]|nr:transcription termination factor Rho [Chlamydiia bacterium]
MITTSEFTTISTPADANGTVYSPPKKTQNKSTSNTRSYSNTNRSRTSSKSHTTPRHPKREIAPAEAEVEVEEENIEVNDSQPIFTLSIDELHKMRSMDLRKYAQKISAKTHNGQSLLKQEIIFNIARRLAQIHQNRLVITFGGVIEIPHNAIYGFARSPYNDYKVSPEDVHITQNIIKKYQLKTGDTITGIARPPKQKEKYLSIVSIKTINFYDENNRPDPIVLENEITEHPNQRILFETGPTNLCGRMIDLVNPMGLGQRGIISAPPRTGKTAILKSIAQSVIKNNPSIIVLVLLIDERPEEVTEMKQELPQAEVVASTFDEDPEKQLHLSEMVYHKAKRLAEYGHNVFLIIDSITRLTRNFNQVQTNTGRSLSGGIDPMALYKAKKFIGLARNIKDGGSISVIASCLINTNSKLDEVVHEEFKGRGNCDIYLSSQLANRRIFPAFDIEKSGTRKEEVLLHADELSRHIKLRRELAGYNVVEQTTILLSRVKKTNTNIELLMSI